MFEAIMSTVERGFPKFLTYIHNGFRAILQPVTVTNASTYTLANGMVVTSSLGYYESYRIGYTLGNNATLANTYDQYLSTRMSDSAFMTVTYTAPSAFKLRGFRMIGFNGGSVSSGSFREGTIEAYNPKTGNWDVIYNLGTLGVAEDTQFRPVKMNYVTTQYRFRARSILHSSNRYVGFRRLWLYV